MNLIGKKINILVLVFILMMTLVSCNKEQINQKSEVTSEKTSEVNSNVVVKTLDVNKQIADIEVISNPKKIAVLDMATLDIIDNLGFGDRVVAIPKATEIEYLKKYFDNENIKNAGSLKEVDMEILISSEPDVIFIGTRLLKKYDELSKIAPVICLGIDYEKTTLENLKNNLNQIEKVFNVEGKLNDKIKTFDDRINNLREKSEFKTAIISIITSSNFNTLGNKSRCSMISNDIGFENLAADVDTTHGNEASFELLLTLNPEYLFVLDRDSAIKTKGAKIAQEIMDNDLVKKTQAYNNNHIVYLNPTAWYLAEGGVTSMDIMISDIESVFK